MSYTRPSGASANASFLGASSYIRPDGSIAEATFSTGAYTTPPYNSANATFQGKSAYSRPNYNSANATFVTVESVTASGSTTLSSIVSSGVIDVIAFTYVNGSSTFAGIQSSGTATLFTLLTSSAIFGGISSSGVYLSTLYAVGASTFNHISSTGQASQPVNVFGSSALAQITSVGSATRGESWYSFSRIGQLVSAGSVMIMPTLDSSPSPFGQISSVGGGVVCVFELPSTMAFNTGIMVNKARILFGEPTAPIIRQVYELSNNRTMTLTAYPEDCEYAVFMANSQKNTDGDDLRIGTIEYELSFDFETKDIQQIILWVTEPNGHSRVEYILDKPFTNHTQLRIGVHCVTKKENQFHLEVIYDNDLIGHFDPQSFIVPIQPHYESVNQYINIADNISSLGGSNTGVVFSSTTLDPLTRIYQLYQEPVSVNKDAGLINLSTTFDNLTRTFNFLDDTVDGAGMDATKNINFYYITDNLGSIQIGG